MCLEKITFEKRPRKVLLFAKSPKFYCTVDLQKFVSLPVDQKNIFAGKGDRLIYCSIN